jgi:Domain of unknown function (DUF4440)
MKLSGSVFCAALALALIAPAALCQKSNSKKIEAAVTQLEKDRVKADLANDGSWSKNHLAESYTGGTSWGAWQTKGEIVSDAADTKNNKTSRMDLSDVSVRVYGNNTAVATMKESYDSTIKGEHRTRKILTTDTWVNEKGAWKLAASHSSQADQKIGD